MKRNHISVLYYVPLYLLTPLWLILSLSFLLCVYISFCLCPSFPLLISLFSLSVSNFLSLFLFLPLSLSPCFPLSVKSRVIYSFQRRQRSAKLRVPTEKNFKEKKLYCCQPLAFYWATVNINFAKISLYFVTTFCGQ